MRCEGDGNEQLHKTHKRGANASLPPPTRKVVANFLFVHLFGVNQIVLTCWKGSLKLFDQPTKCHTFGGHSVHVSLIFRGKNYFNNSTYPSLHYLHHFLRLLCNFCSHIHIFISAPSVIKPRSLAWSVSSYQGVTKMQKQVTERAVCFLSVELLLEFAAACASFMKYFSRSFRWVYILMRIEIGLRRQYIDTLMCASVNE